MDPGNYAMQHVSRRFNGSPERAFEAWTDARLIKQWLDECGCDPSSVELVLGIGEAFHVTVQCAMGQVQYSGQFQHIDRNRRLVFWLADMRVPQQCSRVTVDFEWTGSPDCGQVTVSAVTPLREEWAADYLPRCWETLLDGLVKMLEKPAW